MNKKDKMVLVRKTKLSETVLHTSQVDIKGIFVRRVRWEGLKPYHGYTSRLTLVRVKAHISILDPTCLYHLTIRTRLYTTFDVYMNLQGASLFPLPTSTFPPTPCSPVCQPFSDITSDNL